jgi:hypothetical protein
MGLSAALPLTAGFTQLSELLPENAVASGQIPMVYLESNN